MNTALSSFYKKGKLRLGETRQVATGQTIIEIESEFKYMPVHARTQMLTHCLKPED